MDIQEGRAKDDSSKYDMKLIEMLKAGKSIPDSKDDFLKILLAEKLYKSAEYLLEQMDQDEKEKLELDTPGPEEETMSVLFQLIEEDIILKIMEQLHLSQWLQRQSTAPFHK